MRRRISSRDIFVRAYRAIGTFRGDSAFGSWLYRIAVNVVHSHADRQRVRDGVFPATSHDANLVDNVAGGADLEEAVLRRQIIDRALATLPEELRILIVLRDVHGLKYRGDCQDRQNAPRDGGVPAVSRPSAAAPDARNVDFGETAYRAHREIRHRLRRRRTAPTRTIHDV